MSTATGAQCIFPFNYNGVSDEHGTEGIRAELERCVSDRLPTRPVPSTVRTTVTRGLNAPSPSVRTTLQRPGLLATVISLVPHRLLFARHASSVPNDAVVYYVTVRKAGYWAQNGGSTQGGTLVWIYGARFAQNTFNSVPSTTSANTVQLVDGYAVYDCEMHNDKTTSTQLTCYAPALPESVYQVRVYVNGNLIPLYQYSDPNRALFASMPSQTPAITGIAPQSGTPQTLITLTGSFKTACYSRDVDGCAQDNNPLISR